MKAKRIADSGLRIADWKAREPLGASTRLHDPQSAAIRNPQFAIRNSRRGYTLFELILVLSILVILSALAYPSLDAMYGGFKLQSAADQVRAGWARARAQAMDEGRPYRFAIIPDKGNYRIAPDTGDHWGNGGSTTASENGTQPLVIEEALPHGIRFCTDKNGSPAYQGGGDSALPPEETTPSQYTAVATFRPDGTAREDAEILLQTRGARPLRIRLRGLTGTVTVQPVREEER